MRAGRGFRVILHGESWFVLPPDSLNSLIIQVQVRYLHIIMIAYLVALYRKTVILRGHLTQTGDEIFHRMVQPPMTIVHFVSFDTTCPRQNLVA